MAEALALGLLVTDTGQLLTLVRASQQPLLDLALILAGAIMAIVPAVLATAVGLLGHADAPGNGLR